MEQPNTYLDLTILSASDLSRNWLSGDQTVAVVWVDPSSKISSKVASGGGSNVQWQEKLTLPLNGANAVAQGKRLTIAIHSRGRWGNSLIGTVYVPLVDLASDGQKGANAILTYQIVQPSGKRHGSLSFVAKVVKPIVVSGSVVPLPSVPPLAENRLGLGFNTSYPPPSGVTHPSVKIDDEGASFSYSPYPVSDAPPYPPQSHLSQNHAPECDAWQHVVSPYPSYGMASRPPHVYPPVNMTSPPYTPPSNNSGITPYPPLAWQSSETPYPPPTSVYPPLAQQSSEMPYPPPSSVYPPLARQSSEMPYPPPSTIYPPPPSFPEAPYPPTLSYASIAPHSSQASYPPASLYPYPSYPTPLYPPPYPPKHAPVHFYSPYPTYCGATY